MDIDDEQDGADGGHDDGDGDDGDGDEAAHDWCPSAEARKHLVAARLVFMEGASLLMERVRRKARLILGSTGYGWI